jgi:phosphate transport system substrate-binding protein
VIELLVAAALAAQAPPITMSGAVPTAAVTADLAFFYRRAHRAAPRFDIVGGSTNTGIADAFRGVSDVGLVTRGLAPGDPDGLVFTPIARTGFCLVTNRANPVPGLTRAQVQDLVAARVTQWTQVPGATRTDAIGAAALPPGGGAQLVFESTFLDPGTPQSYVPRTFTSSAQVRDFLQATPNAWGYVDLAFTRGLHTVPYEGVACTRATVASRAYPARSEIGFVTRGRPAGRMARFIRWVRRSAKARRVIATRYAPVR